MLLPSGERLRSATLGRAPNAAAVSKGPASFAMSVEFVNTIAAITRVRIDLASMQSIREIIAAFRSTAQLVRWSLRAWRLIGQGPKPAGRPIRRQSAKAVDDQAEMR